MKITFILCTIIAMVIFATSIQIGTTRLNKRKLQELMNSPIKVEDTSPPTHYQQQYTNLYLA